MMLAKIILYPFHFKFGVNVCYKILNYLVKKSTVFLGRWRL